MKNLQRIFVLMLLLSTFAFAKAQGVVCGITQPYFYVTNNPNGIPVFHDTSTYAAGWAPSSYLWTFGDGTSSTLASPSHVYAQTGTYTVCMYVTAQLQGSNIFCTDTFCKTVTFQAAGCGNIQANFTATNSGSGVVVLQSTTTGTITNSLYQWWMDGTALTNPDPNTAYTLSNVANGNHTFCLYVYNSQNVFCDSTCKTVAVNNSNPCGSLNASFTATSNNGAISVVSNSTGVPTGAGYQWYINGTSTAIAPTYSQFSWGNLSAGTYNICLYIWVNNNQVWCDSTCQTVVVQPTNPCTNFAVAINKSTNPNGVVTLTAVATPASSSNVFAWSNGATTSSITTTASGVYCVTAYNSANQCSAVACDTVNVNTNPCNVTAQFTYQNQGNNYSFVSAGNTTTVTHKWNVNGATVGTTANLTYTFPTNANTVTYLVCHFVNIPGSACQDSVCTPIVVPGNGGNPCLNYTVTFTQNTTPAGYTLTASASGSAVSSYTWSNGATGQSINVNAAGVYCVTAINTNQCSASFCDSVGSNPNPCNLVVTVTAQQQGFFATLVATVSGGTAPYTYLWNNGVSTSNVLTVNQPGTYCVQVTDANGCVATYCYTYTGGTTTGSDTLCGVVFNDLNGNGVQDAGENGIDSAVVYIQGGGAVQYAVTSNGGHWQAVVAPGTYTVKYCVSQGNTITIPQSNTGATPTNSCPMYTVTVGANQNLCGLNFGVQNNSVNICGTVYFDANNNSTLDAGSENGLANIHVLITKSNGTIYHAYTNVNGSYCINVPAGTYTITIQSNNFNTCAVNPGSLTVTGTAGQQFSGQNIGVYCQPGICNLAINVTPHTTVTPGFPAWYSVQVTNLGTGVSSGTMNFFYDNALTFTSASPAQTSHNASTKTLTWNVNNLLPGNSLYYWVNFSGNTNITIGQFVFTLANVNPTCSDANFTNNVDTIHQAVTASWDPNNKLAYTTNHDPDPTYQLVSSIQPNQRIEYVINFQNTGNLPAVNVVVNDIISTDLDMSTFELLGASHPMTATVVGNDVSFKFNNIMLPDSVNDEPNSHGFVKFAIHSNNGLAAGHVISDDAAIYFDYNAPVITNDAAVIMLNPTGLDEATAATLVVYPNPMSQYALFRLDNASGFKLRVNDITGRLVTELSTSGNTLQFDRGMLSAGVYTYQVIQNNQPAAKGKLVIE